jgi:hypothetical protein
MTEEERLAAYWKGVNKGTAKALYDLTADMYGLNQYKHRPLHVQIDKVQKLLGNDWQVVVEHD